MKFIFLCLFHVVSSFNVKNSNKLRTTRINAISLDNFDFNTIKTSLINNFETFSTNTLNEINKIHIDTNNIDIDGLQQTLSNIVDEVNSNVGQNVNIAELQSILYDAAVTLTADYRTLPVTFITVFLMVVFGFGQDDSTIGSPFEAGSSTYNPQKSDDYYGSRPLFVFRRLLKLAQITGNFNIKLLYDWRMGKLEANEEERAKEALELITQLGPTYIKLGQALSIRTDLIPKAYALEFRKLQDAVPPFDSDTAKDIIKAELGVSDLSTVFKTLSDKPVASASIGQVYRGTLLDGTDVAVKVQRPNILGAIALDLYLLRLLTPLQVKASNAIRKRSVSQADIDVSLALVDEWGRGFVAEVDYRLEAANTKQFQAAMIARKLDAVTGMTHYIHMSTIYYTAAIIICICFYTTHNVNIHFIFALKCLLILYSYMSPTQPPV